MTNQRPPEDDEYLDIDLDDTAEAESEATFLEIEIGAERAAPPPRQAPPAAPSPAPLPMVRGGVCQRCGYALRPLEEVCPRCKASAQASPPLPPAAVPEPAAPEYAPAPLPPQRAGCGLTHALIGGLALAAIALAVMYVWFSPTIRARAAYREGLKLQLAGDFAGARERYRECLTLDPTMALAAFASGTTYLGLGTPNSAASLQKLMDEAMWGRTEALDEADRWFRYAIQVGQRLNPSTRLMDQRINTPLRLQAYCRASLALTALTRYSAAVQADQLEAAMAWLGVAGEEAQRALSSDPTNDSADQILKALAPLQ